MGLTLHFIKCEDTKVQWVEDDSGGVSTDVANMIQLLFLGARCEYIYILGDITQRVNGTNYLLRTVLGHRDRITVKEIDIYTSGRTFRDRFLHS